MKLSLLILAAALFAVALSCTSDADCGGPDQAGLCSSGICQCGVGYSGNQLIDPTACTQSCSPPAVPDSQTFLNEPIIALGANSGLLQLNVSMDVYSKQIPTTIAFNNPTSGSPCALMPAALGQGKWSQEIIAPGSACDSQLNYASAFAAQVGEACWESLAPSTESGSSYDIVFSQYRTQVEVIQSGKAPFGLSTKKRQAGQSETTITREFRRNYVISVATQFKPSSAPFQVIAGGRIRYRLVNIDYDILNNKIVATVETEVRNEAKLYNSTVNTGASSGLGPIVTDAVAGDCEASSSAGFCNQMHVVEFSNTPCQVASAEMVLDVEFACADGSDPTTCGFTNLPAGNVYSLNNLFLDYDACPRVIEFGVDGANSFLRLHTDVPRTVPVSAPALVGDTLYGLCSVQPAGDAQFQSVELAALKVFQVASPNNIDLGNQLSSTFLTLLSDAVQTSPSNPQWIFDLNIDGVFFDITEQYFLEATLNLVFANTGSLTKRIVMPLMPKARRSAAKVTEIVVRQASGDDNQSSQDEVKSSTFRLQAPAVEEEEEQPEEQPSSSSSSLIIAAAGAVGGVALCALAAVLIVFAVKKRRRRQEEEDESTMDSVVVVSKSEDSSSDSINMAV